MDRGIYSTTVFINHALQSGFITQFGADFLRQRTQDTIHQYFGKNRPFGTDKLFYLDTPLETCLERLQQRNRPEEENLKSSHLKLLNELYNEYLVKYRQSEGRMHIERFFDQDINKIVSNCLLLLERFDT